MSWIVAPADHRAHRAVAVEADQSALRPPVLALIAAADALHAGSIVVHTSIGGWSRRSNVELGSAQSVS
jgi:hypothetical protein